MNKANVLKQTKNYIKKLLGGEGTGHDWFHIERVVRNAKEIAKKEGGDLFTIEIAALLHDIADWKFHEGDESIGPKKAEDWLRKQSVSPEIINEVSYIVRHISYKGGTNKVKMRTLEGKIVQDADRLDAMGAIGIARLFVFGGATGRAMHNSSVKPKDFKNFSTYAKKLKEGTSINHFYEKLLLLKDKMNTKTGKKLAKVRHEFMQQYLKHFYKEWGE